jgi:transposase InsO family protein
VARGSDPRRRGADLSGIDWEQIPPAAYEAYRKRLEIVELILDDSIDPNSKRRLREQFLQDSGVSLRTVQNWLARYLTRGPVGLLFLRPRRLRSLRIRDEKLRHKIIELVNELPSRSVPKLRRLLASDPDYAALIAGVSNRSIYRFLQDNELGHAERRAMLGPEASRVYRSFEAPHSLALVQADARDGIWLNLPDGARRKTYLFVWIDDFSRKILFGKYYLDEKLPCLEDSFKYMLLRWGIPVVVYADNGNVYISRQFRCVLAELRIRELHHKPFQSAAKGKVEAVQKTVKNEFQSEAARAGMKTLEELNSAFWAWAELEYNSRIHSSTGQAPDERFQQGLPKEHRRVEDLAAFQAMFLWKDRRTVSKWGTISLHSNRYPVRCRPPKSVVQVRYDPFDLTEILIYDRDGRTRLESSRTNKQVNVRAPSIPEESHAPASKVSAQSVAYFSRLRERYLQSQKQRQDISFQKLRDPKKEDPHA